MPHKVDDELMRDVATNLVLRDLQPERIVSSAGMRSFLAKRLKGLPVDPATPEADLEDFLAHAERFREVAGQRIHGVPVRPRQPDPA